MERAPEYNKIMNHTLKTTILLVACTIFILCVTLFFGLKPKGYRFINQVECLESDSSLHFFNIGMVYSQKKFEAIGLSNGFGIHLAITPKYLSRRRLSRICAVTDINGNELFAIDQWRDGIEATLFDSRGNRLARAGQKGVLSVDSITTLFAAVDNGALYLLFGDGLEIQQKKSVKYPTNYFKNSNIILGFSAAGTNAWRGKIFSCVLYPSLKCGILSTSPTDLKGQDDSCKPAANFVFDHCERGIISDKSGNAWNLLKSPIPKLFNPIAFELLPLRIRDYKSLVSDMVVNFFGFFPFGSIVYLVLIYFFPRIKNELLWVGLLSLLFSTGIEFVQVFIPTRVSQLIDVLLNGAGGWVGAVIIKINLLNNKTAQE